MSKLHRTRGVVALVAALALATCRPGGEVLSPTVPPPAVEVTKDIAYMKPLHPDVPAQKLDVYAPTEPGPWPVVVFAHGLIGKKEGWVELSQAIAQQGAVVFTLDWHSWIQDLAPRDNGKGFREMSEALTCAIRFARATVSNYGGDPQRVTFVGFSSGAVEGARLGLIGDDLDRLWEEFASIRGGPPRQVDCLVSDVSAHVHAFVGVSGPYNLFEFHTERDPELWRLVSPYAHLGDNPDLRVRLIHGEGDYIAVPEASVQLHEALEDAGYDTALTLFDGAHRLPVQLTVEQTMEVARD